MSITAQPAPEQATTPAADCQDHPQPITETAAAARIGVLREQINAVDEAIIRLVNERVALSKNVGKIRSAVGGPRLSLGRENQIIAKFSRSLGKEGTTLAMLLLKVSRGHL